jgi:hypothetical protein
MSAAIPLLLQYAFMAWCSDKKHRDTFTFTFWVSIIENAGMISNVGVGTLWLEVNAQVKCCR